MLIKIRSSTDAEFEVNIEPDDTVAKIKELVQEKTDIHPSGQSLLLNGKKLSDDKTASEYKLESGSKLHLILNLRGGATEIPT